MDIQRMTKDKQMVVERIAGLTIVDLLWMAVEIIANRPMKGAGLTIKYHQELLVTLMDHQLTVIAQIPINLLAKGVELTIKDLLKLHLKLTMMDPNSTEIGIIINLP